jgi:cytochrome c
MKPKRPTFSQVLLGIGALFTVVIFVDLAWRGLHRYPRSPVHDVPGGEVDLGRKAVERYGCGACHVVPGVRQARGRVGPRLVDLRSQGFIAGVLPNSPENLIRWIQAPRDVNPLTAMPNLGVTEEEARHIAAFLYTLE